VSTYPFIIGLPLLEFNDNFILWVIDFIYDDSEFIVALSELYTVELFIMILLKLFFLGLCYEDPLGVLEFSLINDDLD
jgi:hypothetical protein